MIIISELDFAENIVEREYFGKNTMEEMIVVARCLRHQYKFNDDQIARWIKSALVKSRLHYRRKREAWDQKVEKAIAISKKRDPYPLRRIPIYQSEIEAISQLRNKALERLLFGILVYSKNRFLKNGNPYIGLDLKELFSSTRIPCLVEEREKLVGELAKKGVLEYGFEKNITFKPAFARYEESDERIAAYVSDARELGYQYLKIQYFNDKYSPCIRCGKMIKQNQNRTRSYCSDCQNKTAGVGKVTILEEVIRDFSTESA